MRIESGLIRIRRIKTEPADVEYLRTMRNSFLGTNVYWNAHRIEEAEHRKWFAGVEPDKDFYFVVEGREKGEQLGILGCRKTRDQLTNGEISIYIAQENKSPLVPYHAMALLLDFVFFEGGLEKVYGMFAKTNERAIRFNASFGFMRFLEDDVMIKTELSRGQFEASADLLRKFRLLVRN